MSERLGCQRLEDEKTTLVELSTGQKVCSYCPEWLLECEAKALLELPLSERKRLLLAFEAKRGPKSVEILKSRMTLIFNKRKLLQKGQPAL